MTSPWQPKTAQPPVSRTQAAKAEIPAILGDVPQDEDGRVTFEIAELIEALTKRQHSRASAEWAVKDCIEAGLLTETTIDKAVQQPGPLRHTTQTTPSFHSVPAVESTDSLWKFWHESSEGSASTVTISADVAALESVDVGIIIALKEEFRELYQLIEDGVSPIRDAGTGVQYYRFEKSTPGIRYNCVATFVGDAGELRATRAAERMIAKYGPATIVVVGIAGAIHDEVKLCDVIVADFVESYLQNSKAVDSGQDQERFEFQLSGESYRPSHLLKAALDHAEFANSEAFREWTLGCGRDLATSVPGFDKLIESGLLRPEPNLQCGAVASGPTVAASVAFHRFLKAHDRRYLAVEMESGGVLGAVHEQVQPAKSLVIRGISDFGDDRKAELETFSDGAIRKVAMRNAIALLWRAMELHVLPASQQPHNTALSSARPEAPPQQAQSAGLRISGCVCTTIGVPVDSILGLITNLKDHFRFQWEPASFQSTPPIVYWPVRLRQPTPIHAVQTFAAAALARQGGKVILCLDDLGSQEHTPHDFFVTIRRWWHRVGVDEPFEERQFSSIIGGTDPFDAWPIVQKWLGFTEQRLLEVLEVSKILEAGQPTEGRLSMLAGKRPRRLLTPAMVWACLAQIHNEDPGAAIVTLGGFDERPLWRTWRRSVTDIPNVGHLYNPNLEGSTTHSADQPVHMASARLGWDSQADIEQSLRDDLTVGGQTDWRLTKRIIPWCLRGCVSLPDFVASDCSRVCRIEIQADANPESLITDLIRELDDRLLSNTNP